MFFRNPDFYNVFFELPFLRKIEHAKTNLSKFNIVITLMYNNDESV